MKKMIRIIALTLMLATCLSCVAFAAVGTGISPQSSAYIESMLASTSRNGNTITIGFSVGGTGVMTSIGASCIRLYTSGGTLVQTFYNSSTPSMMGSNRTSYTSYVTYSGSSGTRYYAVVTGYARNSSGYDTINYTTHTV